MVDPAFAALLYDPALTLRRPPPDLPLAVLRDAANSFMARGQGPEVAAVEDHIIAGQECEIPLRIYRPTLGQDLPFLLFMHGGGFLFGNRDSHDAMCRSLAIATGMAVALPEYRLCPEVHFPDPLMDCLFALEWLLHNGNSLGLSSKFAFAGDSAGGQLALALALLARQKNLKPAHIALLYPLIDPSGASESAQKFGRGYMLTSTFIAWAWESYRGTSDCANNPLFDLRLADLTGLPGLSLVLAEYDPLRDEGKYLAQQAQATGVPVHVRCFDGMIHGFAGFTHLTACANQALAFIAENICRAMAMRG